MDAKFATMLGYTQEELENNFAEHIAHACREQKMDRAELLDKLRLWYNGYKFQQNAETVYNPVSIGKFFESGREIILIGARFSTKKHNIADWKTEVLKS